MKEHAYAATIGWPARPGDATENYRSYSRDHVIAIEGKPEIPASSDPAFRGDPSRYNPEELLVASLSSCHLLWYLHLCATNGITVVAYRDEAAGIMREEPGGAGQFVRVTLRPKVVVTPESDTEKALALHHDAHRLCFIARSMNFPVDVETSAADSVLTAVR